MDFSLLGPLQANHRGRRVDLGGAKQRVVLAHLLIRANRVVATEHLIDQVWGDEPPDAARKSLHAYISRLRRALGDGATIEAQPPGYQLSVAPARIDAVRFETLVGEARRVRAARPEEAIEVLEEALALWRGPALQDLADELSLQPEIARLEELRLTAVEERLDTGLALGRHAEAVSELEALTREHPLRERLWAQLMLALYRSGRQADALTAYLRARNMLSSDLGIEPSPDLQRLQARVLAQDESLAPRLGTLRSYELLERVGEGSFGVVYRAVQPHVGREVALKVIHPHLAQRPEFVRRLETEAQAVARLEHPRIVPLYDYWRGPDGAFLVMRWLSGGSLRRTLESGPVEPDVAVRIADQVAAALASAHRAGVVHGDVRSSNILLGEDGGAYLTDFLIGTDLAGAPTAADEVSAPAGEPRSALSDQYSLAIVLSELVSGRRRDPGERNGGPLADVITRATALDPAERYPDVQAFAEAFRTALGQRTATRPAAADAANPYKGLRAFQEADRGDFFGREKLTGELVARLATPGPDQRFLMVVGASGSGKSSVVRAGLVPALRDGALPGSERWFITEMYPGAAPFQRLDEALLRVAVDAPPTLMDLLTADEHGLVRAVDHCLPRDGSELVLVVDQLEEAFTLVTDETVRTRFLDSLAAAVTDPHSRLRIIATLRGDFYDRPLAHRGMAQLLRDRTAAVVPLDAEELAMAITRPAQHAGATAEPALIAAVVADVINEPGALPLLQYTLTELFDRRYDGGMTLSIYRALGGVIGAVARRADDLHAGLDPAGREAARQLFLRLVAVGEGSEDTRQRVTISELRTMDIDQAALESVINEYGRHRLLSFDRDHATREPTVEVAHEALLGAWGRLRTWIDEAREDLRAHRHLATAAADWEAGGRDSSDLWRGSRLDQAEAWANGRTVALMARETAFLTASAEARETERAAEEARRTHELDLERRSVRRLRALAIVLAGAAFVAAVLGGFAMTERARAERSALEARTRELAAAARDQLTTDPELSVLLALEAVRTPYAIDGTVLREAEEALHRAVQASRVVLTTPSGGAVAFSPDGAWLATSDDSDATIVEVATGDEVRRLSGHEAQVFNIVFGPEGDVAASNAFDGTTSVWDVASGEQLVSIAEDGYSPLSLAVSPDGRLLATSSPDAGMVQIRDLRSGDLSRTLEARLPLGINFSPDGEMLAAAEEREGLKVWEVASGELVLTVPAEDGLVDVAFSPDGELLAAGGGADGATVWTTAGEVVATIFDHPNVQAIAFSPDSALVATGSTDGTARLWDATTGRPILTLAGHATAVVNVAFSPDGRLLASGSSDGTARVWDISPEGSREWLTVAGHPLVVDVSFSPDGRLLATSGFDHMGRIFNAATGEEEAALAGHEAPVRRIGFSPDGTMVVTASVDETAAVWDVETGDRRLGLRRDAGVGQAIFSPDGDLVATADESGSVTVWEVGNGEIRLSSQITEDPGDFVPDIAWRPDGRTIAFSTFGGLAGIWNASTGEVVTTFEGHLGPDIFSAVLQLAVSPDGAETATASWDGTTAVWDADTGQERLRLAGHGAELWAVDFSHDGRRLATGGDDGTARIWDVASGRELLVLTGHASRVTAVEFSPDGTRLATAGMDGTVRIHALVVEDLVRIARERVTRQLTDAECRQYLHVEACPDATRAP